MSNIDLQPYSNLTANEIIIEALERCGKTLAMCVENDFITALTSLNIIITDWARYNNLYSIQPYMLQLAQGQASYLLPIGTADIPEREVTVGDITRQFGGTAFTTAGGTAANAFDGNIATSCIQTSTNGAIGYIFTSAQAIGYIGIQTTNYSTYDIVIEYSFTGAEGTYVTAVDTGAQSYSASQTTWYVNKQPVAALYWRIRETAGATLSIEEVYFSIFYRSRLLSNMSRSQYQGVANKLQQAAISTYIFDRDVNPYIKTWPVYDGDPNYPYLLFNLKILNPRVTRLTDVLSIPNRFYEALHACLAAKLIEKYDILALTAEKVPMLTSAAENAIDDIQQDDTEHCITQFTWGY